tara:strand:+ start:279 stop:503 length:225 start_codon:yes stop_codon:yes gene_type:complete
MKLNNMNREDIYNEVIQDYSHLQYEYEGDELQDKINEIVDNEFNRFLDAHQLTEEQLNDKEYIESLYNNYNENK